jgi:hypothetical protein
MGSLTAPHFSILLYRLGSNAECASVFGRRAPQERCVQFWFGSKPGGVILPPEPDELMLLIYSFEALNASEVMGKCKSQQGLGGLATLSISEPSAYIDFCIVPDASIIERYPSRAFYRVAGRPRVPCRLWIQPHQRTLSH